MPYYQKFGVIETGKIVYVCIYINDEASLYLLKKKKYKYKLHIKN